MIDGVGNWRGAWYGRGGGAPFERGRTFKGSDEVAKCEGQRLEGGADCAVKTLGGGEGVARAGPQDGEEPDEQREVGGGGEGEEAAKVWDGAEQDEGRGQEEEGGDGRGQGWGELREGAGDVDGVADAVAELRQHQRQLDEHEAGGAQHRPRHLGIGFQRW